MYGKIEHLQTKKEFNLSKFLYEIKSNVPKTNLQSLKSKAKSSSYRYVKMYFDWSILKKELFSQT